MEYIVNIMLNISIVTNIRANIQKMRDMCSRVWRYYQNFQYICGNKPSNWVLLIVVNIST